MLKHLFILGDVLLKHGVSQKCSVALLIYWLIRKMHENIQIMAFIQGVYFFITGLWPIVHMPSFLFVSGPKTDLWLVKTVGILIVVIGSVLLAASTSQIS